MELLVHDGLEILVAFLRDVVIRGCCLLLPCKLLPHPAAGNDRHHQPRLAKSYLVEGKIIDGSKWESSSPQRLPTDVYECPKRVKTNEVALPKLSVD